MRMTVATHAIVVLGLLVSPRPAPAQVEPFKLRFRAPEFSLRLGPQRSLAALPHAVAQAGGAVVVECPMPVFVPDLSHVERMPVARLDPPGHALRIAPIRCVNPLGPQAGAARPTAQPQHP
jgi:hypothetical protein